MARYPVNFPLILSRLLLLMLLGDVFAIDPRRAEIGATEISRKLELCNFNKDTRTYNSTDLLDCLYEMATNTFLEQKPNFHEIEVDRAYEDTRQSYPVYPSAPHYSIPPNAGAASNNYGNNLLSSLLSGVLPLPSAPHYSIPPNSGAASDNYGNNLLSSLLSGALPLPSAPHNSIPPNAGAASNNYGNNVLSSLLSGALPLPNLSNLFNFGSSMRPGFSLFDALSSISRYDDLKCVPRLLCEVASGSMPGSLAYRQSTSYQNFGQNALFGLLTAFDASETSPLLSFGKAALLGYTNKGLPQTCYREYSRCPQSSDQLISYLNNHNGGFFRLFSANTGSYYRPQQSSYKPYYKNSVQSRIVQSKPTYSSQSLLGPEADRTGTGTPIFAESDYGDQDSGNTDNQKFFGTKLSDGASNKVVFPKEKRENHSESNRVIKSFGIFNDVGVNKVHTQSLQENRQFFPQKDESQNNINTRYVDQIQFNRRPRTDTFEHNGNYVSFSFPSETVKTSNSAAFIFPSHYTNY